MEYDWYYEMSYVRDEPEIADKGILVMVPFCGTYGALNDLIDSEVEQEAEWLEESQEEGYEDGFYASFDMVSFLRDYVRWIGEQCGLPSLKFHHMSSPKEYNFYTDSLYASVDKNELWELYEEIRPSKAYMAEVDLWTTPVDGYIPFYKPWECYYESIDDMNQGCLLQLILNAKMTHYLNDDCQDPDEDTTVNTLMLAYYFSDDKSSLREYLHY